MAKFTFKRHPLETGLASVSNPYPWVDIKLGGKVVGVIHPPSAFSGDSWRIRFMVVSETDKCGWAWVRLKAHYESEKEARDYITTNCARLQDKLRLHTQAA